MKDNMSKIFISYRREDSADVTGRIGDRLREKFGKESVFTDVDNIPLGVDFRTHIGNAVSQCDVLLAVIGKDWLSAKNTDGEFRLHDPTDYVRTEIESALRRDIPVIPLLVQGATMPQKNQLPESIDELKVRHAQPIRADPDFNNDANRLVESLVNHFRLNKPKFSRNEKRLPVATAEDLKTRRSKLKTGCIGAVLSIIALITLGSLDPTISFSILGFAVIALLFAGTIRRLRRA